MKSKKWALEYPQLGTGPLAVEPCLSREYFEQEREQIFRRTWLNVGREEQILNVGDCFVKDLLEAGSILLVRGKDAVIRGFHNLCSHRGSRLVRGSACSARRFVCGFHGWTYDLEGKLIYVPDEDQFFDLKKSEHGLKPVAADIWQGFIFINLSPDPAETLSEFIGELSTLRYPFAAMQLVAGYRAEVNANWKVCMNIAQEGYHIPFVHKRSIPDSHSSKENPFSHFLSVKLHSRHHSASWYANPEHRPRPAEALAFKYGAAVTQRANTEDDLPQGLSLERGSNWAFDEHVVFPNLIMLIGVGWYLTHRFWPLALDRTQWETDFYMAKARNAGELVSQEFSKVLTRDLLREDFSAVENVQAGLASGVLARMQLSDQEILLRHFYKVVGDFVGSCNKRR
jgi:phenylpropionate dioxygenase-like ring-hydroxylating dioxygenase large terminal subunit